MSCVAMGFDRETDEGGDSAVAHKVGLKLLVLEAPFKDQRDHNILYYA